MTTRNGHPPMLDGCDVLPAMEPPHEQARPKRRPSHRKTGNRFAVLNAFVDTTAGELSRSEVLVWLVLYRDTRDGIAETSQADIARRCGTTDRAVRNAIQRLKRRDLLTVVYQGGLCKGPSKYRVNPTIEG
jgi:hypothetical protein